MSRQTIIDIAAAEQGTTEIPANSNRTKYGKWYGLDGVAWCAMFVSFVYDKAGHPLGKIDDVKGFRYCPSAYNFWKANKRITTKPQKGDIVLFDWTGDGKCDHTGIFVEWKIPGKTFISWEGNTAIGNDSDGGQVMLRTRNSNIVKAFVNAGVIIENTIPVQPIILQRGSTGSAVTLLQRSLYDLGYTIIVDGSFGPGTEKILKQFQREHGLEVTGTGGPVTEGAIEAELNKARAAANKMTTGAFLKKGDAGAAVLALQKALNKKGASPAVNADGVFGSGTQHAIKNFQQKNGLTADGVAGPATFQALGIRNL